MISCDPESLLPLMTITTLHLLPVAIPTVYILDSGSFEMLCLLLLFVGVGPVGAHFRGAVFAFGPPKRADSKSIQTAAHRFASMTTLMDNRV